MQHKTRKHKSDAPIKELNNGHTIEIPRRKRCPFLSSFLSGISKFSF